ncbi:hypothetical protein HRR83_007261 [Exophiala dermatitidis]|uniref:RBR-type E3 ubiquitin transferase n=1 Tax=Exophiala dermatitidis TaxID=5970 RepID=A0AAN6EQ87_EXODE|nr:hypothetical protein HRR73_006552 [Exophiala dermatitidis]KAJ4511845.1 hypothetical protein HRR74_006579 [Exophiala dermatitidis]KAJ4534701.1 hypothetical protein HRR76_006615 [Exophiala dermatitidis]KAJ4550947.1 hypothetical protein HRR77_003300 [Exophiala dermatitidis]KAJ4560797.1 hypothetical protein HRR79_007648 [Exophiala dermatitidis]
MAQPQNLPRVDPDGDAKLADGQAGNQVNHNLTQQDLAAHQHLPEWQVSDFGWPPLQTMTPSTSSGSTTVEDRLEAQANDHAQPALTLTNQHQQVRHPFEIGTYPAGTLITESVTPEQAAVLPPFPFVFPGDLHAGQNRLPRATPEGPNPHILHTPTNVGQPFQPFLPAQQPSVAPARLLHTRDSLELIEEGSLQVLGGSVVNSNHSDRLSGSLLTNDSTTMASSQDGQRDRSSSPVVESIYHPNLVGENGEGPGLFDITREAPARVRRGRHRRRMTRPEPQIRFVACSACLVLHNLEDLLNISCGCHYCTPCLEAAFRAGCTSRESFPPKCCGQPLRISVWGTFLPDDINARYKAVEAEFSDARPVYCAVPTCSVHIPKTDRLPEYDLALCPQCATATCIRCREELRLHQRWTSTERQCPPVDAATKALQALSDKKKWKQCPTCWQLVERIEGCGHMDCVCGVEFCYICGNLFDEHDRCKCVPNSWAADEDREDEEADAAETNMADGTEVDDTDMVVEPEVENAGIVVEREVGNADMVVVELENANTNPAETHGDVNAHLWPDFRAAVGRPGQPASGCRHRHTAPVGGDDLTCHGCLQNAPLRGCNECGIELCRTCLRGMHGQAGRFPY